MTKITLGVKSEEKLKNLAKKLEENNNLFNQLQLAELLSKSLNEIQQMSTEEYQLWLAYFKIKQERTNNG